MRRAVPRRAVGVLGALAISLTLAACGGGDDGGGGSSGGGSGDSSANEASDIGITEDSIKLGAHFPLTGVAAPELARLGLPVPGAPRPAAAAAESTTGGDVR